MNLINENTMLVSTDWLEENYSDPNLRIFDCTVLLKPHPNKIYEIVSGKSDYDLEHIPNSDFLDIIEISIKDSPVPFMMPDINVFNEVMSNKGISDDTHVILYSRDNIHWATRVWWMLKSVNFHNVSILNGGFDKWKSENKPLTDAPIQYSKSKFTGNFQEEYFCTKEEVLDNMNNKNSIIINALRKTLHNGTDKVDYGRPGHIINSINIPSLDLINKSTYLYKPLAELKEIFEKHNVLNKDKVIVYCGGGISATNIAFVLTALNYKNITIYDASLNEWAKDNNLPMTVD